MPDAIKPLPPSVDGPTQMQPRPFPKERSYMKIAIIVGGLYGIVIRLLWGYHALSWWGLGEVMSNTFIFGVPVVMGFITVYISYRENDRFVHWIYRPWGAATVMFCTAAITLIEGIFCIIVMLPLVVILSSVGGLIAGFVRRSRSRSTMVLAAVMFLPLVISPIEQQFDAPREIRVVETSIDVAATPRVIWENIRVVRPIGPDELGTSFTDAIGFPRPIEATISGDGVGAVRHATFEGDVLFVETVTVWVPERRLEFSIKADPNIPPSTFDEHVVVGGRYFDVLDGAYRIEPLATGGYRLHLTSRQRLSTRFNFYTGIWTGWFMRDIQNSILQVIKRRCEKG